MSEWIRAALDIVLIGLVGAGLVQAARLIKHLAGLQQGRTDMERFVHEFNATVVRAETGIKNLKIAARDTGDDLEKLVGRAGMVRDELQFLVESADQIAERLSQSASSLVRPEARPAPKPPEAKPAPAAEAAPSVTPMPARKGETPAPSSRAEKELLQALQKLS